MKLKLLASYPSFSDCHMSEPSTSVKKIVETESNLGPISFANVIKSLLVDLINKRSRCMSGRPNDSEYIEVNHGL